MNALPEDRFGDAVDNLFPQERAAANWALRVRAGLSPAEAREFERWLARDPDHATYFAELNATSHLLDQLQDPALVDTASVPAGAVAADARQGVNFRRFTTAALGAAAALVLAGIGWWRQEAVRARSESVAQSFVAAVDASRSLTLPDGSLVQLAPGAAVQVLYTVEARRVRLSHGEAYFSVAKLPGRPFHAEAGEISVRAVGTAFNVRYESQAVEVIVTEGRVRVEQAGQPVRLSAEATATSEPERLLQAGERARIAVRLAPPPGAQSQTPPRVAPPLVLVEDWQARRLEFVATPLAEVVAEFNRHNAHKLAIGDPALAHRTFGGVFAPTGYQSFVEVLEQSFGISAEQRPGLTILRVAQ